MAAKILQKQHQKYHKTYILYIVFRIIAIVFNVFIVIIINVNVLTDYLISVQYVRSIQAGTTTTTGTKYSTRKLAPLQGRCETQPHLKMSAFSCVEERSTREVFCP